MPRKKSDITGKQIRVTVRVTESQRAMFHELGGSVWLRKILTNSLEEKWQKQNASMGTRILNRVFGR